MTGQHRSVQRHRLAQPEPDKDLGGDPADFRREHPRWEVAAGARGLEPPRSPAEWQGDRPRYAACSGGPSPLCGQPTCSLSGCRPRALELRVDSSGAVRMSPECPWLPAMVGSFWHERGTVSWTPPALRSQCSSVWRAVWLSPAQAAQTAGPAGHVARSA